MPDRVSIARQAAALNRKGKYSFGFPAALRLAVHQAATARRVRDSVVVVTALTWFTRSWETTGAVPPLLLIDPDRLPAVDEPLPATFAVSLPDRLVTTIDAIATTAAAGSNRSAVVRYAVCAYLEASVVAVPRGVVVRRFAARRNALDEAF